MNYLDGLQACPYCKSGLVEAEVPGGKIRPACPQCGWIHWKNPIPTAVALIPVGNKVLMVKRAIQPQKGDWCLPGGYVDYHESPIETIIREVREETGLDITVVRQLGLPIITESNHLVTFFLGNAIGGDMQAGDDAQEVALYTLESLPDNIAFPQHRTKIEDYYAGKHECPFGCTATSRQSVTPPADQHCQTKDEHSQYFCPSNTVVIAACLIYMSLLFGVTYFMHHFR